MFEQPERFQDLMARLRAGSDDAAQELVTVFGPHVYRAVKRRFRHRRLKVTYETQDCIQSVWRMVFENIDRVAECNDPKMLANFLARIASNKIVDRHRDLFALKNAHEAGVTPFAELENLDNEAFFDKGLTPSQQAVIREEVELRTKELSSEKRTIFGLHSEGYTSEEIKARTNSKVSERGIRRVINDILKRFGK